jgi:hypothetical protein
VRKIETDVTMYITTNFDNLCKIGEIHFSSVSSIHYIVCEASIIRNSTGVDVLIQDWERNYMGTISEPHARGPLTVTNCGAPPVCGSGLNTLTCKHSLSLI